MTTQEINSLLELTNEKIEALQEKIRTSNQDKYEKFTEIKNLFIQLTNSKKLYYDYETLLGFAYPDELTNEERGNIKTQMPIIRGYIENIDYQLKEKLKELI